MAQQDTDLAFLSGGGEMGRLTRAHDWMSTPLGDPQQWPQSLRTAVRLMLNTGHPMYIWWGPELACLHNDAYSRSIGPERHPGSLGKPGHEVWAEIWGIIGPQIDQVMAGRGATWNENALVPITRHGKKEDVYWTYSYGPINDETAPTGVGGVLVVCTETTEAVLAKRRETDAAQRQRRLFEQAPGFIIIMRGSEHIVEFVNDAHRTVFSSDDWVGRSIREAFPSIEGQGFFEQLDRVFETGATFQANASAVRYQRSPQSERETRYLTFIYAPLFDNEGSITGVFCEGFDVTEAQTASRQASVLAELGDRIRQIADPDELAYAAAEILGRELDVSRAGYGSIDLARETISIERDWNAPGVESLAGTLKFRDYGTYIDELKRGVTVICVDAETDPRTAGQADALKAISAQSFINMPITERDGIVALLYLNHALPRTWTDEEITLVREVAERTRTAVERRKAEEALQLLNATLEERVVEEVLQRAKAEEHLRQAQKMEAIGQLTGGIAHDFNNMLAVVIGGLNLLQRKLAKGETDVQRFVDGALEGAHRAAGLTQRLLAFSRQQPLEPKPVDVNRMVAGMSELLTRTLGELIGVETVLGEGLWQVEVDPGQLESAILNLSVNARDAMPAGGKLTIETSNAYVDQKYAREWSLEAGQFVLIAVSDTGEGMSDDVMAKAFDPFYTTKAVGKGTGLGLSQVYGFVRQSAGNVKISSELDVGTSVRIYLPRYYGSVEAAPPHQPRSILTRGQSRESVMVVEDDDRVRAVSAEALRELGYSVTEFSGPVEALRAMEAGRIPSLLFTDVVMPGMSGRELVDEAKRILPSLKVLYTTGYTQNAIVHNGALDAGTNLLSKPYSIEELAEKVRRVLDRE
jgi:signal transduction histidine kinase/PAS domain-containing protein